MQFTVPQFIEQESKIWGPFTFRQFVLIGISGGAGMIFYFNFPFLVFLITLPFLLAFVLIFGFIKIGGRSVALILGNMFKFSLGPKVYIWKKKGSSAKVFQKEETIAGGESPAGMTKESNLKRLGGQIEAKK